MDIISKQVSMVTFGVEKSVFTSCGTSHNSADDVYQKPMLTGWKTYSFEDGYKPSE